MEKYFKNYEDAIKYIAENVLNGGQRRTIQIEKITIENSDLIFYKLKVDFDIITQKIDGWQLLNTGAEYGKIDCNTHSECCNPYQE